ncbi:MAG TPA: hypothetical protein VH206_08060 [Xanthobacteraceae bacterium]|jgi:hypothetical protein|nr:hypothetical protein [Xanthobacteraceae bacterium]
MIKGLVNEITLAIQARSGASGAVFISFAIITLATLTAFVFLCVAAYDWLALRYDSVEAGLIMAGAFAVLAIIAAVISALIRRRVRERAILARAAKAHTPSWLLDPRLLATAVEAGKTIGWQRIIPVVLLGFMAAQWTRESRGQGKQHF